MKKQNSFTVRLIYSAVCLTLCMLLPFLTGQIPKIGIMLLPMHLPVLLCGFLCGWPFGLAVGLLAPILRFAVFGVPVLFPTGIAMALELGAYGTLTGIFSRVFPKNLISLYIALILAMIGGRCVWGLASFVLLGFSETAFPLSVFWTDGFLSGLPGVCLQLLLLPPLIRDINNIEPAAKE